MERWVKNLFLLTVLFVWVLFMGFELVRGELPEPPLWGVPGGIWLVLNPPFPVRKANNTEIQDDGVHK